MDRDNVETVTIVDSQFESKNETADHSNLKILLFVKPVDCRRGIDGLSSIAHELNLNFSTGTLLLFRNASGNRLKAVQWDGNGVWLWQRRLHKGSFFWPDIDLPVISLTKMEWQWLTMGVDWQRLNARLAANLKL